MGRWNYEGIRLKGISVGFSGTSSHDRSFLHFYFRFLFLFRYKRIINLARPSGRWWLFYALWAGTWSDNSAMRLKAPITSNKVPLLRLLHRPTNSHLFPLQNPTPTQSTRYVGSLHVPTPGRQPRCS